MAEPIEGVILDLSGVLYQGDETLPGAREALQELRDLGLPVRCVTNTTRTTGSALLDKLDRLGLKVDEEELLTAARAARDLLERRGLTPLLVTRPDLKSEFAGLSGGEPDAVLIGDAAEGFHYEALNQAFRLLMQGAPLLAINRNRYFAEGDTLSLDAGPFVAALEYAAGVEAEVIGKPQPALFQAAAQSMGCAPERCVMVGDDVEADVNGALAAGMHGLLVRTGKFQDADPQRLERGGEVVTDIREAVTWIAGRR